ncbi:MAG: DNA polymerase III subunit gamma/tau [Pseudomonadota bacterium]
MSYEVLARKLRPQGFAALVGQDHVVRALRHALDNDRLHHAYLFTGTRGVGKTTIARILAKALNCETGVSADPCGVCSICREVKENRFVDLIEVDAASRTGVDDTRDLLENAQYLPARGRYKVYLIDEVHMLSTASFNALLKTLEEPPEHVKFLLATTDPKRVPVTVLSRCLQFQLKNLSRDAISDYIGAVLGEQDVQFDQGALELIARNAAGSMRDALSLTDQAIAFGEGKLIEADVVDMLGIVGREDVQQVLEGLAAGNVSALLDISAELAQKNADFADLLKRLQEAFHEAAVSVAVQRQTQQFSAEEAQLFYQIALVGLRDLPLAPDPRTGFEMTLLRMLSFAPEASSTVPPRLQSGADSETNNTRSGEQAATLSEHTEQVVRGEQEAQAGSTPQIERSSPAQPQPQVEQETQPSRVPQAHPEVHPGPGPDVSIDAAAVASTLAASETRPAQITDDLRWYELVSAAGIAGVTRMIADNSYPVELSPPAVKLVLDEKHETLLSEGQRQQLQRALQETLATDVELEIELGQPAFETPAQRSTRLAAERQEAAEAHIQQDAAVASLLSDFDGRIDDIRPVG